MDPRFLVTVFASVFVAELADKTQLATMLFASNGEHSKLAVFLGAALALIAASALAVFAGALLGTWLDQRLLARFAGAAFVGIGLWTFLKA